jgi:hypothetical protein
MVAPNLHVSVRLRKGVLAQMLDAALARNFGYFLPVESSIKHSRVKTCR